MIGSHHRDTEAQESAQRSAVSVQPQSKRSLGEARSFPRKRESSPQPDAPRRKTRLPASPEVQAA